MDILKYSVEICQTCFMLKGHVVEKWNDRVEVVCACQISDSDKEYLKLSRRMVAKVYLGKEVKFFWMPGSSFRDENDKMWQVPLFSMVSGNIEGEVSDLEILERWLSEIPKEKLES